MKIDIVTIFPDIFIGPFDNSIIGRSRNKGILELSIHDLRDYTTDRHHVVDDYSYGGGPGMVMKPEPFFDAVKALCEKDMENRRIIYASPQGKVFNQGIAEDMAKADQLIFLCGHYEGVDERVIENLVTDEISIGDFILTGGELPTAMMIDSIVRLLPGSLGNEESHQAESFSDGWLEYPQYTRPAEYMGCQVPSILLSGNHAEIRKWRLRKSIERTYRKRPDIIKGYDVLTKEEKKIILEMGLDGEDRKS